MTNNQDELDDEEVEDAEDEVLAASEVGTCNLQSLQMQSYSVSLGKPKPWTTKCT